MLVGVKHLAAIGGSRSYRVGNRRVAVETHGAHEKQGDQRSAVAEGEPLHAFASCGCRCSRSRCLRMRRHSLAIVRANNAEGFSASSNFRYSSCAFVSGETYRVMFMHVYLHVHVCYVKMRRLHDSFSLCLTTPSRYASGRRPPAQRWRSS